MIAGEIFKLMTSREHSWRNSFYNRKQWPMKMEPLFPIWALHVVVQTQVSNAWHRVFAVDLQTALQLKCVVAVEKVH